MILDRLAGRIKAKKFLKKSPVKLNVGCGTDYKEGWVNIDNNSDANIKKLDLNWSMKFTLPFPDNSIDLIFNEHFLEHLTPEEGIRAVKDFLRILKPGGILRIAMPDLVDTIKYYSNENWKDMSVIKQFGLGFIKTRGELLNVCFRYWGHKWLYDWEELERRLKEAGCVNIKKCRLNESANPLLLGLETRKESTLIAEVIK